jgi:hypothetical protein
MNEVNFNAALCPGQSQPKQIHKKIKWSLETSSALSLFLLQIEWLGCPTSQQLEDKQQ